MTPKLIDAHTHVQFAAFQNDWEEVIQRALEAGVWLVNVGTQKDTSARAVEVANKYAEGVYATVGLHPIHTHQARIDADELGAPQINPSTSLGASADQNQEALNPQGFMSRAEEFDYEYYKKLAQDSKVVAIGECGLDYYRIKNDELGIRNKQEKAFIQQIELAHEIKKPLMIHCRDAYDDLIFLLTTHYQLLTIPGIIHFFSGTKNQAQKLLDMGFYFTFGGVITFAKEYEELVRYIPLDRILLETDAPYVAPAPYRGKRNEPLYVVEVAKKVGEIKNEDLDKVLTTTTENVRNVLGLGTGS